VPDYEHDLPLGSFERLLRDYKFKLASEAVQQCNGNKTLAAQSLSISRAYLHRLLRQSPAQTESNMTEISGSRQDAEPTSRISLAAGG
jgi:DNA-binding NtrC family response regulator